MGANLVTVSQNRKLLNMILISGNRKFTLTNGHV